MSTPDHLSAYDAITERLMADLVRVNTRIAARRFARDSAKLVRREERQVPEFYVPEFLDILKDTVVARFTPRAMNCSKLSMTLSWKRMLPPSS